MNIDKRPLISILFALAGVLFLVPVAMSSIQGRPINPALLVIGLAMLPLAFVFYVASGRKSG